MGPQQIDDVLLFKDLRFRTSGWPRRVDHELEEPLRARAQSSKAPCVHLHEMSGVAGLEHRRASKRDPISHIELQKIWYGSVNREKEQGARYMSTGDHGV